MLRASRSTGKVALGFRCVCFRCDSNRFELLRVDPIRVVPIRFDVVSLPDSIRFDAFPSHPDPIRHRLDSPESNCSGTDLRFADSIRRQQK